MLCIDVPDMFLVLRLYVCLVISTWKCRKYFRKYFDWYSVKKKKKLEKKMKRINFINLFSLLGDENNFLS